MEFLYSQRYSGYARQIIGYKRDWLGRKIYLTMASDGCLITASAMLLSYFNYAALFPDQLLAWLKRDTVNGLTTDGRLKWLSICDAAGGNLRYSTNSAARPGERTFGIRKVDFGPIGHYVFDHPVLVGKIIDPYDGRIKDHASYRYVGENHFYFGK